MVCEHLNAIVINPHYFHYSKVFVWYKSFILIFKIFSLFYCTIRIRGLLHGITGQMKIPSHLSGNFPQLHNAQFSCVASPRCPLVLSDAMILLSLEPGFTELELHGSR